MLIMPGPHRGSFCLWTWATINTSSIHYNLSVSILHHQKPQWASAWFDKQTKLKDLSEKPAGVGILEYYDTLFPSLLGTSTVTWLGMVLCTIRDQQRCTTTKLSDKVTAQQNPMSTYLARTAVDSYINLLTLRRTRFSL